MSDELIVIAEERGEYVVKDNAVSRKSKSFAIRIINLYKFLCKEKREFVMSKQLLRCGTSIGANIAEGVNSISKKEFIAKLNISLKKAFETRYWLELLVETDFITQKQFVSPEHDCTELIKILTSRIKTTKENMAR